MYRMQAEPEAIRLYTHWLIAEEQGVFGVPV
jgi:hypothetical protein